MGRELTLTEVDELAISEYKGIETEIIGRIKALFSKSAAGGYVSHGPDKVVVSGSHQHLSRK
jgi:hypothetical protein